MTEDAAESRVCQVPGPLRPISPEPLRSGVRRTDIRPAVRQTVRILVSVMAAWLVGLIFGLHETIWALVTALIVTQSSISQTVTTARDQLNGTFVGAVAGTLAITAYQFVDARWTIFWIALAPLAFLASLRPSLRFAGVTLMIVYLFPSTGNPYTPLAERLGAIFSGVIVSVLVSYLVLHASARRHAFDTAAKLLREVEAMLDAALRQSESWSQIEERNQACVLDLTELTDAVAEARREFFGNLDRRDPVLVTLPDLMRRVQQDAALIARAIDAGKGVGESGRGFERLHAVRPGVSHAIRTLAQVCERQAARGKVRRPKLTRADVFSKLEHLGPDALPEMRFVMVLLRQDLETAVSVLMESGEASADKLRATVAR
jgi:uncharacterized membrane protein YgaE (UPF0421/DUF939 family)